MERKINMDIFYTTEYIWSKVYMHFGESAKCLMQMLENAK